MGPYIRARSSLAVLPLILTLSACGRDSAPNPASPPTTAPVSNEIPAAQLNEVIRAHLAGLGHMERYEYADAAKEFRKVRERAPGWIPGSINLAIALLNDTGAAAEAAKKQGGPAHLAVDYSEPLALLDDVIKREPNNLHAHYCRGLILQSNGKIEQAHLDFKLVTERDPIDGHAWLNLGATLGLGRRRRSTGGHQGRARLVELYTKALECNPRLVTAMYRLQRAYMYAAAGDDDKAAKARWLEKYNELELRWRRSDPKQRPAGPGDTAEAFYGEAGKYALIIDPFPRAKTPAEAVPPPRFEKPVPIKVTLPQGCRWATADDFTGPLAVVGRARTRFGATIASFDANGDGRTDLFLAATVVGPKGVRDALLLNKGDGAFEDASAAWGLPEDRASLGAAAGDFDADRNVDVFLTGLDDNRLLRNLGQKFEDVSAAVKMNGAKALALTARWIDIDQDGDLDLYVVNYTERSRGSDAFQKDDSSLPKVSNAAYRNDGRASGNAGNPEGWAPLAVANVEANATAGLSLQFTLWPEADALHGPPAHYMAIASLFLDADRDLDFILVADGSAPRAVLNDRLGQFHAVELKDLASAEPIDGLIVSDFDKDGRADVAALRSRGRVQAWRNLTDERTPRDTFAWEPWPIEASSWRTGTVADLDLDTWPDLVGLASKSESSSLAWARNDGKRLTVQPLAVGAGVSEGSGLAGFLLTDLVGDALPDVLLVVDGAAPEIAKNLGNGEHWIALDLSGRWMISHEHMRTNPHGLGSRISVRGVGLDVTYDHTSPTAGLGQSLGPIVLGLGKTAKPELIRFRWPDGTLQCELNAQADVKMQVTETNRKTGSCPVLFTWNGNKFVCIGDFLGGGGLGYLVAPGVYGQPDPGESVFVAPDQLKPVRGGYRVVVTEPMDEVSYLDRLQLEVVDHPPGVSVGLDERFAPAGKRPSGDVIAWKTAVSPVRATDLGGRDVTKTLAAFDRDTVGGFRLRSQWIGYAEEHGIVLDFGDRLSKYSSEDPLVLALAGWVEYPYSQTNYAASTAGVSLQPPTIERLQDDGTWKLIEPHAGYPAGLPRLTTINLTGKLSGPRCVIRLKTNMECYWDQAFVALRAPRAEASLHRTTLPVARAVLEHRGYTREASPDGRPPLLYDYEYVDPAPLAVMSGKLTRLGDVAPLLQSADDHLCVIGPGDEVRLEFDAAGLPPLPEGWTRSYVLKSYGYCKDADPFTATSDRIEPLPWRGMPAFPFGEEQKRARDDAYRSYLDQYQTRTATAR